MGEDHAATDPEPSLGMTLSATKSILPTPTTVTDPTSSTSEAPVMMLVAEQQVLAQYDQPIILEGDITSKAAGEWNSLLGAVQAGELNSTRPHATEQVHPLAKVTTQTEEESV
ncbi:uncharacterized protein A4U43_C10F10560 [Asparagus officinalis]|uniref:Uncharacterized protein n=1 Tax=Asparagus officinalis TaxID=4686 RepID=A0A5P1E1X2_ASPOF|nr:uncharacterized protein A4U43_C10F10560 [Asparagus officinalis]